MIYFAENYIQLKGVNMGNKKRIYEILLKHIGEGNEITSAEIADIIGISEDDTHPNTRSLIEDTMKQYEIPIGSNTKGYFIIQSKKELDKYIRNLDARIEGIEERKNNVKKFFKKELNNEVYIKK